MPSNNYVDGKGRLWKLLKIFYWAPNQIAQCKRVMETWGQDNVVNIYLEKFRRETARLDFPLSDFFFDSIVPGKTYYNADGTGALVEEFQRFTLFALSKREDYFLC